STKAMPRGERIARPAEWATHAAGRRFQTRASGCDAWFVRFIQGRASRPVEKAEALRRRAALPARAPLGARAAIGAAPALGLGLERFASPVAHHAAAEIPSAVPGAPPRLLLRSRFGRHVVVSLGEALHTRGHSRASDLSGYAAVSSGDARVQSLPPECRTRPPVAGAATNDA